MKIIVAVPHYPPGHIGGAELIAQRFGRHFVGRGDHVEIICIESITADAGHPFCVTETSEGIVVHRLYYNQDASQDPVRWGFDNPLIKEWLLEFLGEARPDILHILSGYLLSGSVIEAGHARGIPMVVTLLDFWFVCPLVTLLRPNGEVCSNPVPASRCVWCLHSKKRRYQLIDRISGGWAGDGFTGLTQNKSAARLVGVDDEIQTIEDRRQYLKIMLEKVDIVISHSHFLETKIRDYGINPKQWVYLPNGIEVTPDQNHSEVKSIANPVRIGYLGQIAPHKGIKVLTDAYQELNPAPSEAELHIYGDLQQWPGYSNPLVEDTKRRADVFWEGPYRTPELPEVLSSLDLIVVPSIWYENRPTVIMEAFAHGIPVIASNLGGMAEMVEQGVSGLLFEAGNSHDLAVQLKSVTGQNSSLALLKKGIKPVVTTAQEFEKIEKLYSQLTIINQSL